MKILVTGGAGFIGSEIVSYLDEKEYEVIVYDIAAEDKKTTNVEWVKGDIFDTKYFDEILSSCNVVIHMTGLADARIAQDHPQISFDLNVRSTQRLLEAVRNNDNIQKIVLPSSASVYGKLEPPISENTKPQLTNIYSYHKFMGEELAKCYVKNYSLNVTVLRLFNVYGIQGEGIINILVEKAKKGEKISLYGEKQKRDFIHISDVAKVFVGILKASDTGLNIYNVGTGIGRSIEDVVALVGEYFPEMDIEYEDYEGELYDSIADITKVQNAINFKPDKSDKKLRKTIEKLIAMGGVKNE